MCTHTPCITTVAQGSRQIPARFNFPWKRGRALVDYATFLSLSQETGRAVTIGVFVEEEVESFSVRNARHVAPIR